MIIRDGVRRTVRQTAPVVLFRYAAGDSLALATFTRASTASADEQMSDTLFRYAAGGSLASATFARASTAAFDGNA